MNFFTLVLNVSWFEEKETRKFSSFLVFLKIFISCYFLNTWKRKDKTRKKKKRKLEK